jgi:hypothetical protein
MTDGATGAYTLNGGTMSAGHMQVGYSGGGMGTFTQSGGQAAIAGAITVGGAGTGIGYLRMSGGSLSSSGMTSSGVIEISGGTLSTGNIGSFSASSGSIGISGGTIRAASFQQKQVTVTGGQILLNPVTANTPVNKVQNLAMTKQSGAYLGKIDLNDNDLVVTGTMFSFVKDMVQKGHNGGAWNGNGIASSAAAANPARALGLMSGSQYLAMYGDGATFGGHVVGANDALVKHTWYGDTDFSGAVDFDDYVRTDAGLNGGFSGWTNGDFDYSGAVDFDDYVLIDLAFNSQSGTLRRAQAFLDGTDRSRTDMTAPALTKVLEHFDTFGAGYAAHFVAAVPEPASLTVVGALLIVAARRRK